MIVAHLARVSYPFHPYGGLEQHVYRLTQELAKLGHTVHLFTAPPSKTVEGKIWHENVQHHYIKYDVLPLRHGSIAARLTNYPLFALRMSRAAAKLKPTIVHAHGLAAIGYNSAKFHNAPLVLNPHGMEEFKVLDKAKSRAYAPFRAMLRGAAKNAAAVIATDAALIPEVHIHLKVPQSKIALIPNAVDLESIDTYLVQEDISREIISTLPPFCLLSVGRLEANKGFEVMLESLGLVKDKLPVGWGWVVVGSGSQQAALERETAQAGLSDKVRWLGSVDDTTLHALYRRATVFVHPTLYEGSSLVTLEALANRLPVIASRVGGLPDKVFEQGAFENGRLVQAGKVVDLAQTLVEVCNLALETRRHWGDNGRRLVKQSFSWQAAARQTVALYEKLLMQS